MASETVSKEDPRPLPALLPALHLAFTAAIHHADDHATVSLERRRSGPERRGHR